MRRRIARLGLMIMASMAITASLYAQDALTTLDNLRVEGKITAETADEITIDTERFGVLRFRKINLKTIERSAKAAAPTGQPTAPAPGGMGAPTAGGEAGTTADPFGFDAGGGGGAPSPFGDTTSVDPFTGAPVGGGSSNPGGGGSGSFDPFGGGGSVDPFTGAPTGGAGTQGTGFKGFGVPMSVITPKPVNMGAPAAPAAPAGGGAFDPFGSSAPAPAGGDPFGGPQGASGFGGSGGFDPFGAPSGGTEVASASLARGQRTSGGGDDALETGGTMPAAIPTLPKRTAPPEVTAGNDAVLYGLSDTLPVEVKTKEADWAAAIADTQLRIGSEVRTNETPSSRLLLRGKKDELRLPKQSHIEIETLSADSEQVVINLRSGSIWSEVSPRGEPDAFMIKTPELTAGVRGTNFRVDRMAGASKVSVFTGVVKVTALRTGTFVTLQANQSAVVNLQGQIMDLLAVPTDEQAIYDSWDQWAMEASFGSGASAAGFAPISSLSSQVAQDNAAWEAEMQDYMRNVAEIKYMDKLQEYAGAFLRYAEDTGQVPTTEEGWSVLKFNPGVEGWNGPYVEGPVPPLDPWKHPLVYKKLESQSGRVFGRVYSLWQDGRDQGGVNSSVDKAALIQYFELDRFANDPTVNPPQPQ